MRPLRSPWLWAIFGLVLCLNFSFLFKKPFEYDELLTWHLARADWHTLWICDIEPPGVYLWAKPVRFLSESPHSLRVFEAVMSALWVIPVWAVGETVAGGGTSGLLAALLLTFHPLRLRCGQYGRADALAVLFDLLSLWALVALLKQKGRSRKLTLLFLVLSTLTWFTYLPFVTSLLSRAVLLLFLALLRRASWEVFVASSVSTGLFFLWAFTHVSPHAPSFERAFIGGLLLGLVELPVGYMTAFFGSPLDNVAFPVSLVLNAVAFMGVIKLSKDPSDVAVAFSWVGPLLLLAATCGLGVALPEQGYLSIALGPFSLCLAVGLFRAGRHLRAVAAVFALALPVGCFLHLQRPVGTVDFQTPAQFVLTHAKPGDVIFCQPPGADIPMRYYLGNRVPIEPSSPTFWTRAGYFVGLPARRLRNSDWMAAKRRVAKAQRLWLVEWYCSPLVPLKWPRWPEREGYEVAMRKSFMGHTQAVVVTLYIAEWLKRP